MFGKKPPTPWKTVQRPDGYMSNFTMVLLPHADSVIRFDDIRSACRRILLDPEDKSANAVYSGKYAYRKVVGIKKALEVGVRRWRLDKYMSEKEAIY